MTTINPFDIAILYKPDGTMEVYFESTYLQQHLRSLASEHGSVLLKFNFFSEDVRLLGIKKEDIPLKPE